MKTIGQGKYLLYAEALRNCGKYQAGHTTIGRLFKSLNEAVAACDKISIGNFMAWRLIRTTDNKNFTNRIYGY